MNYIKTGEFILLGVFLTSLILSVAVFVGAEENYTATSIVQANITKAEIIPDIRIQVPDKIDFRNVSLGDASNELKVYINNTGTKNIMVTPQLADKNDEIFSNLYFKRILSEPLFKVGEYTHNITKPSTGGVKESYFYMILDLTSYTGSLEGIQETPLNFIATAA